MSIFQNDTILPGDALSFAQVKALANPRTYSKNRRTMREFLEAFRQLDYSRIHAKIERQYPPTTEREGQAQQQFEQVCDDLIALRDNVDELSQLMRLCHLLSANRLHACYAPRGESGMLTDMEPIDATSIRPFNYQLHIADLPETDEMARYHTLANPLLFIKDEDFPETLDSVFDVSDIALGEVADLDRNLLVANHAILENLCAELAPYAEDQLPLDEIRTLLAQPNLKSACEMEEGFSRN